MRSWSALVGLVVAGCATLGDEPVIVRQPRQKVAPAGLLPSIQSIPQEREGVSVDDTGAIMFICSNSPKHEDKEVFIHACPDCSERNYFYWDLTGDGFRCFACAKAFDGDKIRCPECGRPPRTVRTRHVAK
jgi:hypothetical protein